MPVIDISGESVEDGWQLRVADNGQGIPPEAQEQIFQPLKRLHGKDRPGTGLGLAISKSIVDRHGGRMWVESQGAGKGTTFHIFLRDDRSPAD